MDNPVPTTVRRRMQAVRSTNTRPEWIVRRLAHALGYRYRLHVRSLPGAPDLVFPRLRQIINVNGCFWHRHRCRAGRSTPASNKAFWSEKFEYNRRRDARNRRRLRRLGWTILTVWECELQDIPKLTSKVKAFLSAESSETAKLSQCEDNLAWRKLAACAVATDSLRTPSDKT